MLCFFCFTYPVEVEGGDPLTALQYRALNSHHISRHVLTSSSNSQLQQRMLINHHGLLCLSGKFCMEL